jgi:hypothetical protein
MFPRNYYETFMRYEASDDVFVAMPFSEEFQAVYEAVIEPAVRLVRLGDRALKPLIVNRSMAGAADIHEKIMDGILHSRLVVADMTVQSYYHREDGSRCWQPNANVSYEVGLAAAWRNAEDILLVHRARPDHVYSFDVQSLRHVEFHPTEPENSIRLLRHEMETALQRSRFIAEKAFDRLVAGVTLESLQYMRSEGPTREFPTHQYKSAEMRPAGYTATSAALSNLQSLGALTILNAVQPAGPGGLEVSFAWTDLGIRLMLSWSAIDEDRALELKRINSTAAVSPAPADTP